MSCQRGLRSVQASGEAEQAEILALVANGHQCPGCGLVSRGVRSPAAEPAGFPQRGADARVLRALDLEPTAARLARRLGEVLPASTFARWVASLRLIDASAGTLWLLAPPTNVSWTRDRFASVIEQAATDCAEMPVRCRIVSAPRVEARTLAEVMTADPVGGPA